ncbi:MAG: branched-chain amino acid ABC transporter permease [Candidatus Bathyarchaeota archaeon]|nr:branched-chain amino acid ABC transporter permease [Candidatus Bathyarchaeota archaeon]
MVLAIKESIANTFGFVKNEVVGFSRSRMFYYVLAALAIAAVVPLFTSSYVLSEVLTPMVIFTIYASSWNLLASSGQGSLGHAAFLGIGGFASALLVIKLGIPPIIGLFVGSVFSAVIGLLIGLTCVRLKAWFLGMVTFGFSVIAVTIISQFDAVTGGIMGFRTPLIVERGLPFYYLTFVFAVISVFAIHLIMRSKLGLAFRAIHGNELEAKMNGVNTAKYRLIAFVLSTFFAGLAGGLYAQSIQYIQISIFEPYYSFLPLMICVIGGLGTLEGPIIGSVIIVAIDRYLPGIDSALQFLKPLFPNVSFVGPPLRMLFLGLFLIVIVVFAPKGLTAFIRRAYAYFRGKLVTVKEQ